MRAEEGAAPLLAFIARLLTGTLLACASCASPSPTWDESDSEVSAGDFGFLDCSTDDGGDCASNGDGGVADSSASEDARGEASTMVVFDVSDGALAYTHADLAFVQSLGAAVNRHGPRFSYGTQPAYLAYWSEPGRFLHGLDRVTVKTVPEVLDAFADDIDGIVVWDDAVPATLNVATSLSGYWLGQGSVVPVVKRDETNGSVYRRLTIDLQKPIFMDLSGRFPCRGGIPNFDFSGQISRACTGNAKIDAYAWAIEHLLRGHRVDGTRLFYWPDGKLDSAYGISAWTMRFLWDRDFSVHSNGFVFNLKPWNEPSTEAGDLRLGEERAEWALFREIVDVAEDRVAGTGQFFNFYGWSVSDDFPEGQPTAGAVLNEWWFARLLAEHGGRFVPVGGYANASLWDRAPKWKRLAQNDLPPSRRLETDDGRIYVLFVNGEFDSEPKVAGMWNWFDRSRTRDRRLPVAWGITGLVETMHPIFEQIYATRTEHDWFVGTDTGAGYLFPNYLDSTRLASWTAINQAAYRGLDLTMANFNIDIDPPRPEVRAAYASFAKDGYVYTRVWHDSLNDHGTLGFPERPDGYVPSPPFQPSIEASMPVTSFCQDIAANYGADIEAWATTTAGRIVSDARAGRCFVSNAGREPNFLVFRVGGGGVPVSSLEKLVAELGRQGQIGSPPLGFEVVDPYTFWFLLREKLTGRPESNLLRLEFLEHDVRVSARRTIHLEIEARNDGWDAWTDDRDGVVEAGECFVGAKLLDAAGTTAAEQWFAIPGGQVDPGATFHLAVDWTLPSGIPGGAHRLIIDLVKHRVAWFAHRGNEPIEVGVDLPN